MTRGSSSGGSIPHLFFWLVWLVFWCVGQLVIVGYWHSDNNYGVRPGDYSLRTIDSADFAALTPEQQAGWNQIPSSDKYVLITIKNPFVFTYVSRQLIPILIFAVIALCSYLWLHGSPSRSLAINPVPKVNAGVPNVG